MTTEVVVSRLRDLEVVIERGMQTFVEVGRALEEIRDSKLYREQFPTFEEYCQKRWGMSRQTAYERISASSVIENVSSNLQNSPSFTQALAMATLTPEQQIELAGRLDFSAVTVNEVRAHVQGIQLRDVAEEEQEAEVELAREIETSGMAVHCSNRISNAAKNRMVYALSAIRGNCRNLDVLKLALIQDECTDEELLHWSQLGIKAARSIRVFSLELARRRARREGTAGTTEGARV